MGCDIHMICENKESGVWVAEKFRHTWGYVNNKEPPGQTIEINIDRSYALFSYLADVRNDREPIQPFLSVVRGLPDDITPEAKEYFGEYWGPDGHNRCWYSVTDLLVEMEKDYTFYMLFEDYMRLLLHISEPENLRVIMCFDN